MPEQPHKYLANTRDRNCKLCLRDKDHSIHKEAQEMPLPGAIKEDMLEIQNRLDQCDRLKTINADLLAALEAAVSYLEDDSRSERRRQACLAGFRDAIAKARGQAK